MNIQYVYMIKTREFVRMNENIFKIGRTEQLNLGRFNSYDKGSVLLFQSICENCRDCEKMIIKKFKENFIHRTDFGNEYFEGDCNKMISILCDIVSCKKLDTLENKLLTLCELYTTEIDRLKIKCNELEDNLNCQINNYKHELSMLNDTHSIKVDKFKTKIDELKNNSKFQIKIINELMEDIPNKLLYDREWYYNNFYNDLSKNLNINWEIIKANPDKPWNYRYLSKNLNVTWEIIKANPDKPWNYRYLSENHNITWKIVKENINKSWSYLGLSVNPNITLEIAKLNSNNPWDYEMLNYPRIIISKITKYYYNLVCPDDIRLKYLRELKVRFIIKNN
jgi:hypothetical protein